ncbi:hypothetical protein, partial [Streptomyces sp. NPDC047968]|uniref:hypothetical protein n=1 Tax=Streptomyces sp. NPDC047968 TaxID=3155382 RepID=UPI003422EADC
MLLEPASEREVVAKRALGLAVDGVVRLGRALAGLGRLVPAAGRDPRPEPGAASLYQSVPFRQDTAYLAIGE